MKQHLEILREIVGDIAANALVAKFQTLTDIAKADEAEIQQCEGIGPHSARQIKASLELASRLSREILGEAPLMDTPDKIADYLRDEVRTYRTEQFKVLLLNARMRLIRIVDVATGTLDTVLVHSREVFHAAILHNAAAVVLVHNHPSSITAPSEADLKVTRDLIRAGQLLKIEVVDHVILGAKTETQPKDYTSLREQGYFYA
jgi:DNA repair protein RadC